MSFDVKITRKAHIDILEMTSYISDVKKNNKAAVEHMEGVYSVISSLSEDALKYQISNDVYLGSKKIRFAQFRNFMIAFRACEETQIVYVYGVLYGGRDLPTELGNAIDSESQNVR